MKGKEPKLVKVPKVLTIYSGQNPGIGSSFGFYFGKRWVNFYVGKKLQSAPRKKG